VLGGFPGAGGQQEGRGRRRGDVGQAGEPGRSGGSGREKAWIAAGHADGGGITCRVREGFPNGAWRLGADAQDGPGGGGGQGPVAAGDLGEFGGGGTATRAGGDDDEGVRESALHLEGEARVEIVQAAEPAAESGLPEPAAGGESAGSVGIAPAGRGRTTDEDHRIGDACGSGGVIARGEPDLGPVREDLERTSGGVADGADV